MDVVSHGLWGGIAFGRKNRVSYWKAFLFGIGPDMLSFGPFFIARLLGAPWPARGVEPPHGFTVPDYVYSLYNVTHSLVVFALVFAVVYLLTGKVRWEMFAWPLHILVDMPTHSTAFFPTPFLWPLSSVFIDGTPWAQPTVFIPNVIALALCYVTWWLWRRRHAKG